MDKEPTRWWPERGAYAGGGVTGFILLFWEKDLCADFACAISSTSGVAVSSTAVLPVFLNPQQPSPASKIQAQDHRPDFPDLSNGSESSD